MQLGYGVDVAALRRPASMKFDRTRTYRPSTDAPSGRHAWHGRPYKKQSELPSSEVTQVHGDSCVQRARALIPSTGAYMWSGEGMPPTIVALSYPYNYTYEAGKSGPFWSSGLLATVAFKKYESLDVHYLQASASLDSLGVLDTPVFR